MFAAWFDDEALVGRLDRPAYNDFETNAVVKSSWKNLDNQGLFKIH